MSDGTIDYGRLVAEMEAQKVFDRPVELNLGTKLGIAFGGLAASTGYVLGNTPVVGHALHFCGDVKKGVEMGYAVKVEQINQAEEVKRQAISAANAKAQPAPA